MDAATEITIAAVGDILMWGRQVRSARTMPDQYCFDGMFSQIAHFIGKSDLAIGNLETTLSGRERYYQRRNKATHYPMFNCPDELADTLRDVGFDILTTANNHCMDRGTKGLVRTLRVLDLAGIAHTGTFRSRADARRLLIRDVRGVRVGVLAYTFSTNKIPVPEGKRWMVNRISKGKILGDIYRMRRKADLLIVALHFGREFHRTPDLGQVRLVKTLLRHGADIVLGCHPHVLQPVFYGKVKCVDGSVKRKFAIYSLGNFISERHPAKIHTQSGVIVYIKATKGDDGQVRITGLSYVPTFTHRFVQSGRECYRVIPVRKTLDDPDEHVSAEDLRKLKQVWVATTSHLRTGVDEDTSVGERGKGQTRARRSVDDDQGSRSEVRRDSIQA